MCSCAGNLLNKFDSKSGNGEYYSEPYMNLVTGLISGVCPGSKMLQIMLMEIRTSARREMIDGRPETTNL